MILIANGRGAYKPMDLDSLDQAQAAELVRRILQAAKLEGWQVRLARAAIERHDLLAERLQPPSLVLAGCSGL